MPTSNTTSFCPRCNQQVLLVRKQFDSCLAIILLIFTVIGFFIYLAVYYSKKEDRCVQCGKQITFSQQQVQFQPSTSRNKIISEEISTPKYCPLCGGKLQQSIRFCPNCGSKTT